MATKTMAILITLHNPQIKNVCEAPTIYMKVHEAKDKLHNCMLNFFLSTNNICSSISRCSMWFKVATRFLMKLLLIMNSFKQAW